MLIDLSNALTVEQHVKQKGCHRLWLCPSAVSTGRVDIDPILRGLECSVSTIPESIKTKKVRTRFREANIECIIWENDQDYSYRSVN